MKSGEVVKIPIKNIREAKRLLELQLRIINGWIERWENRDMSANNLILVQERGKRFRVLMLDAETGVQLGKVDWFNDLGEALVRAQTRVDGEHVEYGIRVDIKK